MNAALQTLGLAGVAGPAVDRRDVLGMGIFLDVGVAVIALQAAVYALAELAAIDCNAVARGIGHGLVAVAGEAIGLVGEAARNDKQCIAQEPDRGRLVISNLPGQIGQPLEWTGNDGDQECSETCSFAHAAVFPSLRVRRCTYTRDFLAADFSVWHEGLCGKCNIAGDSFARNGRSDSYHVLLCYLNRLVFPGVLRTTSPLRSDGLSNADLIMAREEKLHPLGAEARIIFAGLAARIDSRSCYKTRVSDWFLSKM